MTLLQWGYLSQVGAINGQRISLAQSGLIALSNWAPYLLIFGLLTKSLSMWAAKGAARIAAALVGFALLVVALAVWDTASVLTIVPSGHEFTTLIAAHLRSGLLENMLSVAAVYGLIHFLRRDSAERVAPMVEVREGSKTFQISAQDILFVESEDYYVRVHTPNRSWLIRRPLYEMLDALSAFGFMRVSRSAIVAVAQVQSLTRLDGGRLRAEFSNGESVLVGKTYRKAFKDAWRQRS